MDTAKFSVMDQQPSEQDSGDGDQHGKAEQTRESSLGAKSDSQNRVSIYHISHWAPSVGEGSQQELPEGQKEVHFGPMHGNISDSTSKTKSDMTLDLSDIMKASHSSQEESSVLYDPLMAVQCVSIKTHSQSMAAENVSRLMDNLSQAVAVTSVQTDQESSSTSPVHCQVTCVEGCIQLIFQFFLNMSGTNSSTQSSHDVKTKSQPAAAGFSLND